MHDHHNIANETEELHAHSMDEHAHEHTHANGETHCHEHAHEHVHSHTHEHTHENGETHTHEHAHEHTHTHDHENGHTHEHTHGHTHDHGELPLTVLVAYMVDHNRSHLDELEHVAHDAGGEAGEQLRKAAETIRLGNEQLAKALEMLKEM